MRAFLLSTAAMLVAGSASVAFADSGPRRTPEQIVCEMTGDCGGADLDEAQKMDMPDVAALSFRKPNANAAQKAPVQKAPARSAPASRSAQREPERRGSAVARNVSKRKADPSKSAQRAPVPSQIRSTEVRVGFALGSAQLTPASRGELEAFATALRSPQLASKRFVVEGHTDAIGDRDTNLRLSQERAEAVAAYLKSLGVEAARLEAKGFGFDKPLPGRSAMAAANRRVQLVPVADSSDMASR